MLYRDDMNNCKNSLAFALYEYAATENQQMLDSKNTADKDMWCKLVEYGVQKGEFNEEAQKEAFDKAYEKAIELISQGSKDTIEEIYGSFDEWLKLKIESSVNMAKKQ